MRRDIYFCSLLFQCWFNIGKLEKNGLVWDLLVVEYESGAPDRGRETYALDRGQVIKDDLRGSFARHIYFVEENERLDLKF